MILILYQLLCAYLAILILRGLFANGKVQEKVVMAAIFIPLVLRLLLVK